MLWLYNFGIFFYGLILNIFALFNPKAKLFVQGRKKIFSLIEQKITPGTRYVWFHFASLGEFEQGRPVLEKIKEIHPGKKIVVTFFSPSGYEVRKNYALADAIFYLPLDTAANARRFVALLNPEVAIFTKYEFWHHYFKALHKNKTQLFVISGIFRTDQVFFKWYGDFYRRTLGYVSHFFVQNEESLALLSSIHLENVSLSGDTRFDRVAENALAPKRFEAVEQFCGSSLVCVAGSTWPADERLLISLMDANPDWKFILAPHEVTKGHIDEIEQLIPGAIKYSALGAGGTDAQTLIIDNIGLLSSLYQYGKIAYIGGGFGVGIHNTLEAAAFGIPVIFGPEYRKFQEAKDLVGIGAAKSIRNTAELHAAFEELTGNPEAGIKSGNYVMSRTGATDQIIRHISQYL